MRESSRSAPEEWVTTRLPRARVLRAPTRVARRGKGQLGGQPIPSDTRGLLGKSRMNCATMLPRFCSLSPPASELLQSQVARASYRLPCCSSSRNQPGNGLVPRWQNQPLVHLKSATLARANGIRDIVQNAAVAYQIALPGSALAQTKKR